MKKSQQLQQSPPSLFAENKCSEDEFDILLSTLPEKLNRRLLPFQKEGIKFGFERNGRRIPTSKITIVGYGLLTTDAQTLIDALHDQNFQVVIVDESHYIKSRNAARSTILVPIVQKAARAVLLTGTPALSRPEELFMQIDALYPRKFGTWTNYAKKYCNAHLRYFGKRAQWDCKGASNLDELHRYLSNIMIRRMKDEVLTQLPPKIRQQIPFDLSKEAAKEMNSSIEEWEKLMRELRSSSAETDNPFIQVMGLITRMYKQTAVAKAGAVKDYIRMMLRDTKLKFLVFAYHLTMLQACTEAAIESKARYIRIDGSIPSSERIHLVHQYQNDPETQVAILSIKAAGQGLTFTAATHVVFAELFWDPGHLLQAEDRAHRIGQCSSVHIHYLIARGTLDSLMWSMLKRKTRVTSNTLNGIMQHLEVEEGDKEKWDFLNTALAWVPNENFSGTEDGVFFTHFEKEKQHDIRSFFLSKPDSREKRKRTLQDLPVSQFSDTFELQQSPDSPNSAQQPQGKLDELNARGGENENEVISKMNNDELLFKDTFEPQTKRLKSLFTPIKNKASSKKKKSKGGLTPSTIRISSTQNSLGEAQLTSRKLPVTEKTWNCKMCTYTNNIFLSYCEMCETLRGFGDQKEKYLSSHENLSEKEYKGGTQPDTDCTVLSDQESEEKDEPSSPTEQTNNEELHITTVKSEENHVLFNIDKSSNDVSKAEGRMCNASQQQQEQSVISYNSSDQVYDGFMFCASRNTDRIHLYTKEREPLNCNFIPLDVKSENWEDLPPFFDRKENRAVLLRFVREWLSLSTMKQRIIRKSGQMFHSPILVLENILKGQHRQSCTKRFITKDDVAAVSLNKAQSEGGTVRVIARVNTFQGKTKIKTSNQPSEENLNNNVSESIENKICNRTSLTDEVAGISLEAGYVQAVNEGGNPLCLACQQPTTQVSKYHKSTAWDTRYCSQKCQEDFLVRSNRCYMRSKVFEAEHGICQQCGLDAQQLFLRVHDTQRTHRKELLENTWLSQLSLDQLNDMIWNPTEGQFWQVDHIRPVFGGGGQCSLENLQTLCTVCHKERTAKQAKERSQARRLSDTYKNASDIRRFFTKKRK
ncbi:DNA annealing helicase and endonuclease ZRANB3 isoform X2 [Stegostoma tigrinum]|uniref:DNA annealing helicase and endonuclease ZRANB3 isoform X2 n=1 Tax=Stegostoma tigrinum TaxID=3053191 RepID=UPI00202B75CD|nr:DNA annealing helicase and endonuclease ZRANB3 isoform X2 [Stegostoma tigrinum]XP_059503411.1 DNA annealing helicase and endonuclease ZRANB3 isoform X2 [Stegostoma tigrinum]XP_059503412.1 DNA annealing helicase and endonuclease ZRANB3 isoform X2 [Stegostoma tigrinum]